MYKPNFCADCGSRVERTRWRPWTSRRFCAACAPRFRRAQFFTPIVAGAALFVIGLAAGRAARHAPTPLIIERGQPSEVTITQAAGGEKMAQAETGGEASAAATREPAFGPDGTATERPTEPGEVVSLCGARTQKGTACQRRVRGTGRCWQHKGMPAILPPRKLIIAGE